MLSRLRSYFLMMDSGISRSLTFAAVLVFIRVGVDPEGAVIVGDQIFVGQGGGSGIIVAGKAAKQENVANFSRRLLSGL